MNRENRCYCCKKGSNEDFYNVPSDAEGNSILTGDGKEIKDCFTLAAIETWHIQY